MKNLLVGCEYSGIVRDAFENAGWNAWSCDLLPTESEQTKASGKHIQGDVMDVLTQGWDLIIAHPPCNCLSYAGMAHWNNKGRVYQRLEALKFFADLWVAPVKHICIENPMGCASPTIAKYSQIVHPYQFGDPYTKRTCLWLKNLPLLESKRSLFFDKYKEVVPTHNFYNANNCAAKKPVIYKAYSSGKERSRFHRSIAMAMAEQWTEYISLNN